MNFIRKNNNKTLKKKVKSTIISFHSTNSWKFIFYTTEGYKVMWSVFDAFMHKHINIHEIVRIRSSESVFFYSKMCNFFTMNKKICTWGRHAFIKSAYTFRRKLFDRWTQKNRNICSYVTEVKMLMSFFLRQYEGEALI